MNKGIAIGCSATAGRAAYDHDLRRTISKNVDQGLIVGNITIVDEIAAYRERWIAQNDAKPEAERKAVPSTSELIYGYIDEQMQPYMDAWNAKKKPSRRFNGTYTEWHRAQQQTASGQNKKGDLIYELVIQYGSGEDIGKRYFDALEAWRADRDNPELKDECLKYRKEFIQQYRKWEKDLEEMGLKVLWATIHFDEGKRIVDGQEICGTPHMHVCICPITDPERIQFQRGPAAQVSMYKTLEAIGICRKEKRAELTQGKDINLYQLGRFFVKFRETQERDVRALGYEIKERAEKRPHLSQELYIETKRAEKNLEVAQEALEQKMGDIDSLKQQISRLETGKASMEVKLDGLVAERNELRTENNQLKTENQRLKNDKKALESQIDDLERQHTLVSTEVVNLEKETNRLQVERDQAQADKEAAIDGLRKIEEHQKRSYGNRKTPTIYEVIPEQPEKTNRKGQVVQEAREECYIVGSQGYKEMDRDAAFATAVKYNQATIDEVAKALATNEIYAEQKQTILDQQMEINRLRAANERDRRTIKEQDGMIRDRDSFIQEKGMDYEFESQIRSHSRSIHHHR